MIIVRLLSPEPAWLVGWLVLAPPKVCAGIGADIVMESISPLRGSRDFVNREFWQSHRFLKCIHTYVNREKMPSPSVEMTVAGVQNRRILNGLLLSRLAAKNRAK